MFKNNKKYVIVVSLALCCAIILSAFVFLRLRNSSFIIPSDREDILNQIPIYRQDDIRWSSDNLGNSSFTMKSSGCLVSCIAAATGTLSAGELNKFFSDNNVYDINGNIQWAKLEEFYTPELFNSVSEEKVYSVLKEGHYPIVRVRVNAIGSFHYVLITGIEDNEYICMDPLKDNFTKLSDYGSLVYAMRVVYTS